jgi:hypothetical protein
MKFVRDIVLWSQFLPRFSFYGTKGEPTCTSVSFCFNQNGNIALLKASLAHSSTRHRKI